MVQLMSALRAFVNGPFQENFHIFFMENIKYFIIKNIIAIENTLLQQKVLLLKILYSSEKYFCYNLLQYLFIFLFFAIGYYNSNICCNK